MALPSMPLGIAGALSDPGSSGEPELAAPPAVTSEQDEKHAQIWDNRIDDAIAKWTRERDWRERFVKLYKEGKFPVDQQGIADGCNVNLCFSYVTFVVAMLGANLPVVQMDPRRGQQDRGFAKAVEGWEKYELAETGFEEPMSVCLFDAVLRGISWLKSSFDPQSGLVVADALTPLEVHVDPLARYSLSQARFIIQRVVKPIDEARNFFNTNDIEPNYMLSSEEGLARERSDQQKIAGDKDLLLMFEIWAKEPGGKRMLYHRQRQESKWLGQKEWPYTLDRDDYPYARLCFNTNYTSIDGFSEQAVVEALESEINEMAEFDRRHTRRGASVKLLYDLSRIDEIEANKLLSSLDYEAVGVKPGEGSLSDAVHVLNVNQKDSEQKEKFERSKALHDEVLNYDELQRGVPQRDITATQADIIDETSKVKINKRQKAVDNWLSKVLRHRIQIGRKLVDPQLVAQAVSPEAGLEFALYAGNEQDLVREFSISVEAGSAGERAKARKIQTAQQNLALFAQVNAMLMQRGMPALFDEAKGGMKILEAQGERNPEEYLLPPPMPLPGMLPGMPGFGPQEGQPPAPLGAPAMGGSPPGGSPPKPTLPPGMAQGMMPGEMPLKKQSRDFGRPNAS